MKIQLRGTQSLFSCRCWGDVIDSSMHFAGRSSTDAPMSSAASIGSSFRFLPVICLGIAAALLFQFGYGGLTITSFFLKLFIYISFALFCFLLGSFGLLVKKGPPKISRFETSKRQSAYLLDLFNKLMVSILNSFYLCSCHGPFHCSPCHPCYGHWVVCQSETF